MFQPVQSINGLIQELQIKFSYMLNI